MPVNINHLVTAFKPGSKDLQREGIEDSFEFKDGTWKKKLQYYIYDDDGYTKLPVAGNTFTYDR